MFLCVFLSGRCLPRMASTSQIVGHRHIPSNILSECHVVIRIGIIPKPFYIHPHAHPSSGYRSRNFSTVLGLLRAPTLVESPKPTLAVLSERHGRLAVSRPSRGRARAGPRKPSPRGPTRRRVLLNKNTPVTAAFRNSTKVFALNLWRSILASII